MVVSGLSWEVAGRAILEDISFTIKQGDFVGLIGANGSGKSSLMRCCYRVNRPTSGCVRINGEDVWVRSLKANAREVAVILQEHHDQLGLTVKDVVFQGLSPHKALFEWDTHDDHVLIDRIVQDLDLTSMLAQRFSDLSGGEKQRVMLARALVQRPQLLIMDEPTNHLDVHYQIDLLNKVKALGITVLASFHDLNLASAYCDQLLVLRKGKLFANGAVEEVLSEELVSQAFNARVLIDTHPVNARPRVNYVY